MSVTRRDEGEPNFAPLDAAWDESRGTRPGRYTGVGPKRYKRTDARILEDVNDELVRHPDLDATGRPVASTRSPRSA